MNDISVGVAGARVGSVNDEQYHRTLLWLIQRARWRVFASVFIVDIAPGGDGDLSNLVVDVLHELRAACLRGVDVRLLIGGSTYNPGIDAPAEEAYAYARKLGVPCELMSLHGDSSHKKLVIADDRVLTGSHNWSHGAWSGQRQDSVLVDDPRLAAYFADIVAVEWQRLLKGDNHAAV